nr:nucleoside hydrolase [Gammaproteobacteria bacterium]
VQLTYLPLDVTHKLLTSDARLQQLAAVNTQASKRVVDILNVYIKHDMALYGMPGGPVHDASVIAYLLKPELFSGRRIYLSIDSREGPTFGQTVADWHGVLKQPANVLWVEQGDAQGLFDLLSARLARLQ